MPTSLASSHLRTQLMIRCRANSPVAGQVRFWAWHTHGPKHSTSQTTTEGRESVTLLRNNETADPQLTTARTTYKAMPSMTCLLARVNDGPKMVGKARSSVDSR